jgi:hypothetical protein
MCRTRSLTLLLLCASLASCGYHFTLDGRGFTEKYAMEASLNRTQLIDAGSVLDANLERTLTSMGMLASGSSRLTVHATLTSFGTKAITAPSLSTSDRYRVHIDVECRVTDEQGKNVWNMSFSDTGTYTQGGSAEDALDEACGRISLQIARTLATLSL